MAMRSLMPVVLAVMVALSAAAVDPETTVRSFRLENTSVRDAAIVILPVLSPVGSLTLQPHDRQVVVQDRPEVVAEITRLIARIDRSPERYRIKVDLVEGSSRGPTPAVPSAIDQRLRRMFKFAHYRQIGSAVVDGDVGASVSADLGEGHHLTFVASSMRASRNTPWGMPSGGDRIQLEEVTLVRLEEVSDGGSRVTEILRTSVSLSAKQEAIIGAGASEDAPNGLVLILSAESIGGP
jgi:hypothetical protein